MCFDRMCLDIREGYGGKWLDTYIIIHILHGGEFFIWVSVYYCVDEFRMDGFTIGLCMRKYSIASTTYMLMNCPLGSNRLRYVIICVSQLKEWVGGDGHSIVNERTMCTLLWSSNVLPSH